MTQAERDREALVKDILKMARIYRATNGLFEEDPITIDIPAGQWHLLTQRDVEFFRVFHIKISDEARIK